MGLYYYAHVPLSLFRVGKREMDGKFVSERVRAESSRRIICLAVVLPALLPTLFYVYIPGI